MPVWQRRVIYAAGTALVATGVYFAILAIVRAWAEMH